MKKIFLLFAIFLLYIAPVFAITDDFQIEKGQTLYLIDCIKLALINSPDVKKAYYDVKIANSNIKSAKSDYFPTIGLGIDYENEHRSNPAYDDCSTKGHRPELSVYLEQTIFNFGKTLAKIDMNKFQKIAAEYSYRDTICYTINNVKIKYMDMLHAMSYVEIEKDNLAIAKTMLNLTKNLYNNGKKAETDYSAAQVYVSDAEFALEKAINTYKKAKSDLCNAIYIYDKSNDFKVRYIDTFNYYDAYFSLDFLNVDPEKRLTVDIRPQRDIINGKIYTLPFSLDEAEEFAKQNNNDILVVENLIKAMEKNILIAKRQYYPSLTARVAYDFDNKFRLHKPDHYISNNQLSYMIGLTTQINAMKVSTDVDRAKAQLEKTKQDSIMLKNNIFYNVQRAYYDVETAQKQIENSKNKIGQAINDLTLTHKQYLNNKIGYLEFQQSRIRYNESKLQYIDSLKNYNTALAHLERETHRHNDKIVEFAKSLAPDIYQK
jgi:outer membrane protein TolC